MSCASCGGKGIIRLNWSDAEPDFAVCLCPAAAWYRSDMNAGRHTGFFGWQVWAYQQQIAPSRIFLLEEALTPAELSERGFHIPTQPALIADSREAALLSAGKTRKAKL